MVRRRATPAGTGPPRSPVSSAGRRTGRPNRTNRSWCIRSSDSAQTPAGTRSRRRIAWDRIISDYIDWVGYRLEIDWFMERNEERTEFSSIQAQLRPIFI